ncbi:MAG: SIMPL domain-containing protein [bacterium]
MTKHLTAIIFGIAIVAASVVLGNAFMNRNKTQGTVAVTGLGQQNFTSDLIVWDANFSQTSFNLKQAYSDLNINKNKIKDYLVAKGIPEAVIVFSAVSTNTNYESKYSGSGEYVGREFNGYTLTQSVQIESQEVDKVEKISREVTELLNQGIQLYSTPPRYYYTKLDELKIEMISQATENARLRAEKIAENSKSNLGDLIVAKMGIFQITGQNSNEDYSWGGAYNTSSREKTASITMKLTYGVK